MHAQECFDATVPRDSVAMLSLPFALYEWYHAPSKFCHFFSFSSPIMEVWLDLTLSISFIISFNFFYIYKQSKISLTILMIDSEDAKKTSTSVYQLYRQCLSLSNANKQWSFAIYIYKYLIHYVIFENNSYNIMRWIPIKLSTIISMCVLLKVLELKIRCSNFPTSRPLMYKRKNDAYIFS